MALLLTLISGLFFALGFLIVRFYKNKQNLSVLATSMALVIMLGMLFFDLLPEIIEVVNDLNGGKLYKVGLTLGFIVLGVGILKMFDIFVPHHHHNHDDSESNHKEHNNHSFHIGLIMAVSLILHNILEGMSIYIIGSESFNAGLIMALGVGLHNLPLGIEIGSNMALVKGRSVTKGLILVALILSTFIGGLVIFVIRQELTLLVEFILLCLACGMIIYISLFELLKEVFNYKNNRYTYVGVSLGLIVLFLMTFLE